MSLGGKESLKQTQQKVRRVLASPCDRPPASPTGVEMRFVAVEAKTHLNFRGKILWDDVTEDTSGLPINTVDRWDIQWRATDVDGNPVEPSDAVDQAQLRLATNPGLASTYYRYTTREAHGFTAGMTVTIKKCFPQTDYNGTFTIFDVPAPSVFRVVAPVHPIADCRDPGEVFHDSPQRVHRTQRRDPVARAVLSHAIDTGARDEIQRVHLSSFGGQNEIQAVSLTGFGGSDRFHLSWGGHESPPLTHGTHYDADKIKYAIEHISGFKGQVDVSAVSPSGFTVEFRGAYKDKNVSPLSVTHPRGCSGSVSTTQQGSGPAASFKLEFPASSGNISGLIERGTNYSPAHVKNRIQQIPGFAGEVEINNLSDSGFTVHYVGAYAAQNMDPIKVVDEFGCTGSVTTEQQGDSGTTTYRYTTRGPHGFIVGQHVRIRGCRPSPYNGLFTLTGVGPNTFTVTGPQNGVPDAEELGFVYDEDDSLHVPIPNVPRPKTWYWVARVRARSGEGCWSAWSDWTDPVLPWTGADPRPPAPTFTDPGCITFDRKGQHRDVKLRLKFTFDEVQDWDVPGGDHEPDVEAYVVQLDRSDDGITWDGRPYVHKLVAAKDVDSTDDDDTPATRTAIFGNRIRRREWYRCRARTVDRFGRRGDWSDWTSGALPFDNNQPPQPENVEIIAAHDRIIVKWDAPTVDVGTRGTVSGTIGDDALVGVDTKFNIEVEAGQRIRVGADEAVVKRVNGPLLLHITDTWSVTHTDAALVLIDEDPDVAAFDVQIGRANAVDQSATPDDWSAVYASDRMRHTVKAFRVADTDDAINFYGRVRSIDAALNKSRWIPARLEPNSDPDANGETVTIIQDRVIITGRMAGTLDNGALDEQAWRVDRHYKILNITALVGRHDPDTHPLDGTPGPGGVELNWRRITSDETTDEQILDSDSRVSVPPNHHKGSAARDDADYLIRELFGGEVIYPKISSVGGGAGPRPGKHLVTTVVLKPIGDGDATSTGGGAPPESVLIDATTTITADVEAFQPTSIASLIAWYDFARDVSLYTDPGMTTNVTSDGDAIAAVRDRSGAGNHLAGSVGERPQYKTAILNGHSVGRWDAVNDQLVNTGLAGGSKSQPNTILVVATASTAGGNLGIFDGYTSPGLERFFADSSSIWTMYGGSYVQGGTRDTSPHIFAGIFDGASSDFWVDGGTAIASGDVGANDLDGITLGALTGGGNNLGGDIAEVVVYNGAIGLVNINKLGAYFAAKWGLTWTTAT